MSYHDAVARYLALVTLAVVAASCGGGTASDPSTGGSSGAGVGGTAGSGGAGASGGAGGSAGAPGGSGGVACGPIVPEAPCPSLSEAECLAAAGRCVPAYDDTCCPSCDPGPCADCSSWKFWGCLPFEESNCVPGLTGHCATTPAWACEGKSAPQCSQYGDCGSSPGCVAATPSCPPDEYCPPECHAVTSQSCGPVCTQQPEPSCSYGVPEVKDGVYTGFCISGTTCELGPECPPEPPSDQPCPVQGQKCNYGPACGGTFCTCNGTWDCPSTPC